MMTFPWQWKALTECILSFVASFQYFQYFDYFILLQVVEIAIYRNRNRWYMFLNFKNIYFTARIWLWIFLYTTLDLKVTSIYTYTWQNLHVNGDWIQTKTRSGLQQCLVYRRKSPPRDNHLYRRLKHGTILYFFIWKDNFSTISHKRLTLWWITMNYTILIHRQWASL
jgi:hypothetical protein